MSFLQPDPEQLNPQQMEKQEFEKNIEMLTIIKNDNPRIIPSKIFNYLKKSVPLSVFVKVYPFNQLVDCGFEFTLDELTELKRLYSTLEEGDQQLYTDSFHNLEQFILESKYPPVPMFSSEPSTSATPIPSAYSTQPKRSYKGFQSSNERVEANKELQNIIHNPEPSQSEIEKIQYQNYMRNRIIQSSELPQPSSIFGKVKEFFGFGGKKRKTINIIKNSRSKSRSKSRS
jgi:hypothetical protein